jgi:hypothetical protein
MRRRLIRTHFEELQAEFEIVDKMQWEVHGDERDRLVNRRRELSNELERLKFIHGMIDESDIQSERCYRVDDIYQHYGFKNPNAMYRAIGKGFFPAVPLGKRRWLIHPWSADIWLKERSLLTMMLLHTKYAEKKGEPDSIFLEPS